MRQRGFSLGRNGCGPDDLAERGFGRAQSPQVKQKNAMFFGCGRNKCTPTRIYKKEAATIDWIGRQLIGNLVDGNSECALQVRANEDCSLAASRGEKGLVSEIERGVRVGLIANRNLFIANDLCHFHKRRRRICFDSRL
jgi:hypothetical protein